VLARALVDGPSVVGSRFQPERLRCGRVVSNHLDPPGRSPCLGSKRRNLPSPTAVHNDGSGGRGRSPGERREPRIGPVKGPGSGHCEGGPRCRCLARSVEPAGTPGDAAGGQTSGCRPSHPPHRARARLTGRGDSRADGMRLARQLPEALRVAGRARTALHCPLERVHAMVGTLSCAWPGCTSRAWDQRVFATSIGRSLPGLFRD
jgi:hypothetical protein